MSDTFQMTIIDRLSAGTGEGGTTFKEMRNMIRRDLEDLLNTRQGLKLDSEQKTKYPELKRSLATYGLNNIDTVDMSCGEEIERLLSDVKHTIEMFEPRLKNVEVFNDSPAKGANDYVSPFVLRMRISADMRIGHYLDPVVFNTLIQKSGATVKEEETNA